LDVRGCDYFELERPNSPKGVRKMAKGIDASRRNDGLDGDEWRWVLKLWKAFLCR